LDNAVEIRKYYSLFYNTMASIIRHYGGKVIKNVGDMILFYFPKTVNFSQLSTFQNVLECGLEMVKANMMLNSKLSENGLPSISYKISLNYGKVELAISSNSNTVDLFGPAVNICSKINNLSLPYQIVIYKALYDIIEKLSFFKDYVFENLKENGIDGKEEDNYSHLVYSVKRKKDGSIFLKKTEDIKEDRFNKGEYPQNQNNSSFNILLIDDDKDILFTFEPFIRGEGYNLISHSDPKEALDHLSNLDPYYYDLIILDIRMPRFNGFQLYKQIKILNPDTKVLFLTALDVVKEIEFVCPGMKESDILRKPVHPDVLLAKIESALYS
jgi:CheY-like chemotaxis protein